MSEQSEPDEGKEGNVEEEQESMDIEDISTKSLATHESGAESVSTENGWFQFTHINILIITICYYQ